MGQMYSQLSAEERGAIMVMRASGVSHRAMARVLGRASSTITRELHRNGQRSAGRLTLGRPGAPYDATRAGERARRARHRPRRTRKLRPGTALWGEVREGLALRWSPQEIARTLRRRYPGVSSWHVSHETIYTAIYAAPRGALRRELVSLLRQRKSTRRTRRTGTERRGRMSELLSIHVRPLEVEERQVPGHWEGDFIKGARNQSAVGVLVCRKTLLIRLARMEGGSALDALEGFSRALAPLPPEMRKTLTYDQGKEMALHKSLTQLTGVTVYFADPHSPWQRGICENTNGLLRQYLPKGTDLSQVSQSTLDAIAWEMNTRPRASLGYHCPAEMFLRACGHADLAQSLDDALLTLPKGNTPNPWFNG